MKTNRILIAALLLAPGAARADIIVSLIPASATISGHPGQTIGWGFHVTPDASYWTSFSSSFTILETNPALGIYTDFIGAQGGPVNFTLPPASANWNQAFSNNAQTGLGSFTIDSAALAGDTDSGLLAVDYTFYTRDPSSCGFCFAANAETLIPFTVQAVPEPGTGLLFIAAVSVVAILAHFRNLAAKRLPAPGHPR